MDGTVAAGYEGVRDEFAEVVAGERADYAGQLVAYVRGELVVDLWTGPEFTPDTLTGVFSSTKGAAYLVVALLVQDGVLDPDQRVSHYWPEFAAAGKQDITLREVLAHRAGSSARMPGSAWRSWPTTGRSRRGSRTSGRTGGRARRSGTTRG
jgi:CubicO group peptidase (beta-lactamase class C family)